MKAKKSDGKVPGRLRFSNWKRVAPLARDFCYLLNWVGSSYCFYILNLILLIYYKN
jgi:hypothetical protein